MKKIICLFSCILIMLCCTSCGYETTPHATIQSGDRFVITSERTTDNTVYVEMYDKNTKVMYVFIKLGYGGGISVLYDENGKPLLFEERNNTNE